MQARFPLLAAALALAACGGSEAADVRRDAPTASPGARQDAAAAPTPVGEVALETAAGARPATGESSAAAPADRADSGGAADPAPASSAPAPAPDGAKQLPAAPAQPRGEAAADAILERVESAYTGVRSMQADFVQDLRVPLLGTSQRSSGKLYQRRPDRFLMKFSDPAGDVIVADGRSFWMYYPSSDPKQVMKTSIAEGSEQVDLHRQFLSDPTARYHATLDGEETVDGHRTHVLTLVPKQQSPVRKLRIWVDPDDYAVRRFEMTEENESVRRIELRNLKRNVDIPDGLFAFTPPRGTQVFEQ
ncbi:MAG TPA: outer membrane lipoprotein chaperone LolA [Longimicrobiaceae bacterium]|nr:outer membrane lipoprotein chaperone LolA [Longimicrobiaceae bacterium]